MIRNWNVKEGSQEIIWTNWQVWPWNTKWSRAKTNRVLPREHTGHSIHLPTTQETTLHKNIRWSILKSDWLYSLKLKLENLYSVKQQQQQQKWPGADCGSDQEILIAKFRLKLKKRGKTTRSFRYDLNKIPYHYTEEVMNRFRGLDLVDRVPEDLWTEVYNIVQKVWPKLSPRKRSAGRQSGCLRHFTNSWGKKKSRRQRRRGKVYHLNAEFQRIARRDDVFINEPWKEI